MNVAHLRSSTPVAPTVEHDLRRKSALAAMAQMGASDLPTALRNILPLAATTLDVARASYWSLVDRDQAILCEALYEATTGMFSKGTLLGAATFPNYFAALRSCEAIDAADVATDVRTGELTAYFAPLGIGAMLDVPVWRNGRLVGVLCHEHIGPPRRWTPDEQVFATSVGNAIAIVLEINARARAEERYRLVAQATGEVIWDWNLVTDEIEWSQSFESLGYGEDASTANGAWWTQRIHGDDRARVVDSIHGVIDGDQPAWQGEYRLMRGDGSIADVVDRGFVVRDDAGRGIRMIGTMRDVSAQKALESRVLLAERMASMGTLAAGVAHEINNPLAYIKGNLDYVLELLGARTAPAIDPDIVLALEDAREGSLRVRDIVAKLATFSRVDAEERSLIDLDAVVRSATAIAWNEIRHRAKLVTCTGAPQMVFGSATQLGQVVVNLLVNAAQAITEGAADANEVRVATGTSAEGRVYIEVTDTGCGIPRQVARRMFDPFFTTKAIGKGTGLGLAICHSIVTAHGGEIAVQTAVGAGTTFRVLLPAVAGQSPEVAPRPGVDPPLGRKGRVLVVDDDPGVATIVKRILSRDHDVETSPGGAQALERLASGDAFDVIVCDLMMPSISGIDVYEEIVKAHGSLADRVIFVTGGAFTPKSSAFMESVSRPCLAKPFDPRELRRAVASLM